MITIKEFNEVKRVSAVFLDRDGVINQDFGYVGNWNDFDFCPGALDALKFLSDKVVPRGEIFNIGSGKAIRIIDVVRTIADVMQYKGVITFQKESKMLHDVSWTADVSKIDAMGYRQSYSLRAGLEETIRHITG